MHTCRFVHTIHIYSMQYKSNVLLAFDKKILFLTHSRSWYNWAHKKICQLYLRTLFPRDYCAVFLRIFFFQWIFISNIFLFCGFCFQRPLREWALLHWAQLSALEISMPVAFMLIGTPLLYSKSSHMLDRPVPRFATEHDFYFNIIKSSEITERKFDPEHMFFHFHLIYSLEIFFN